MRGNGVSPVMTIDAVVAAEPVLDGVGSAPFESVEPALNRVGTIFRMDHISSYKSSSSVKEEAPTYSRYFALQYVFLPLLSQVKIICGRFSASIRNCSSVSVSKLLLETHIALDAEQEGSVP